MKDNFLFIGDVHEPYSHAHALKFCKMLQKDFEIPHSNIYSVGDLLDQYHFSRWPKSPDAKHTANQELDIGRERLKKWQNAFPELKLCESNHDLRYMKKALGAELPSQVIKSFVEIYEITAEWEIKEEFIICANQCEILVCHGEEYPEAIDAAINYGVNVIQGHHHNKFGVRYKKSRLQQLWGASTGCLVDPTSFAFEYGNKHKQKPILGSVVVINGVPHAIPL